MITALFALTLYVLFFEAAFEISRGAETALLAVTLVVWAMCPRRLAREPLFWLLLAWVIYATGVAWWAAIHIEDLTSQFKTSRHFTKVFLILVVAWWLGGNSQYAARLLVLALVGFLLALGVNTSFDDWRRALEGNRTAFGFLNAQHAGLYFGVLFIGTIAFFQRVVGSFGPGRTPRAAVSVALIAICVIGLSATQTRGIVLAVGAGMFSLGALWTAHLLLHRGQKHTARAIVGIRAKTAVFIVFFTLVLASFLSAPIHSLGERFAQDETLLHALQQGDSTPLPYTSTGIRLQQWSFAAEVIKERPLFGWGPVTRTVLIEGSSLPERLKTFGHFHNSYIELLVAYGAVGFLFYLCLTCIVGWRVYRAFMAGAIPADLFAFGVAMFMFYAVANAFESYVIHRSGMYFTAIIGGALYGAAMRNMHARASGGHAR